VGRKVGSAFCEEVVMGSTDREEDEVMYEESTRVFKRRLDDSFLSQPVSRIPARPAPRVTPDGLIEDSIKAMLETDTGCVVVLDPESRLVGIFTERDLLKKIVGQGILPKRQPVKDFMTPNPESLRSFDTIGFALNKMAVGGYRHIPIVDSNRKPTSILSIKEIARFLVEFFPEDVLNLPERPEQQEPKERDGA
jgi:CBS domain-containing protein